MTTRELYERAFEALYIRESSWDGPTDEVMETGGYDGRYTKSVATAVDELQLERADRLIVLCLVQWSNDTVQMGEREFDLKLRRV